MQKTNKLVARAPNGGKKETKKLSGYRPIYAVFYNFICFISLYALVSSLLVFHFTFLMQKIKKLVAGAPDGGGPHAMAQLAPWVIRPWFKLKINVASNLS